MGGSATLRSISASVGAQRAARELGQAIFVRGVLIDDVGHYFVLHQIY